MEIIFHGQVRICTIFKKELYIKSDEESSLVAGVVLPVLRPGECHLGVLYNRKPELATLATFFFIVALMKASFQRVPIKKPGSSIQAFSSRQGD